MHLIDQDIDSDEDLERLIEASQRRRRRKENLYDMRDRLINEGKLSICGYPTPFSPVFTTCKQDPIIPGKLCYYHDKVKRGLIASVGLNQAYRAIA